MKHKTRAATRAKLPANQITIKRNGAVSSAESPLALLRQEVRLATSAIKAAHARNEKSSRKIDRVQGATDEVLARISR